MTVRVLWTLAILLIYMTNPGIYTVCVTCHARLHRYRKKISKVVAGAIAQAFGPLYFSVNFGLMFTTALVIFGSLIIVTQVL